MRTGRACIFAALILSALPVQADDCFLRLSLREEGPHDPTQASFTLLRQHVVFSADEAAVLPREHTSPFQYPLTVWSGENSETYMLSSSRLREDAAEEAWLNSAETEVVLPFKRGLTKIGIQAGATSEIFPDQAALSCTVRCKAPGEPVAAGERCCPAGAPAAAGTDAYLCTQCGDGICSTAEDHFSCAQDCRAASCEGEGCNLSAPPEPPTDLVALQDDSGTVYLHWQKVPGAAGYQVSIRAGGTYRAVVSASSLYFVERGVMPGADRRYYVTALNDGGLSAPSAEVRPVPLPGHGDWLELGYVRELPEDQRLALMPGRFEISPEDQLTVPGTAITFEISGGSGPFSLSAAGAKGSVVLDGRELRYEPPAVCAYDRIEISDSATGRIAARYVAVHTVPIVPGDATGDGHVNFTDLVAVAQSYGSRLGASRFNACADFDGDGAVGFSELVAVAQNYNT